jgi:hypothetical protein
MKRITENLSGRKFGRLTALRKTEPTPYGGVVWLCCCACGGLRKVSAKNLVAGLVRTCGGHRHGKSKSPEYRTWARIKNRCYNPKSASYAYYGKLGITMCWGWRESFQNFLNDLHERPAGMNIDRIDPYSHYSCGHCKECDAYGWPANCKWATRQEQIANRSKHCLKGMLWERIASDFLATK